MLISYSYNNFCSFNAVSEFSMEAGSGKVKNRFPDNYVALECNYDLLKTAVIVGENAGGKSNFINGLKYLKSLFETTAQIQSVSSYVNSSSLLEEDNPVQEFNVCIVADNQITYSYSVCIDKEGIVSEKLSKKKKRRQTEHVVFEVMRDAEGKYRAGDGRNNELILALRNSNNSNGLFISKLSLLGNADAAAVSSWFQKKLQPGAVATDSNGDAIRRGRDISIINDPRYLEIFRMVDYSICGVEVDEDKPYSKSMIIRKDGNGELMKRELSQDSTGVREFFAWAVQIFRTVYEDNVVFADEMDRVLNPVLSDRVIAFINGMDHRGQFVFTTHNILHLNLKTYMKEQIYFITKSRDSLTSELYSLADFPEVRYETTKVYEFYMKGILGGTALE